MRAAALFILAAALTPALALAGGGARAGRCVVEVGPDERFEQDRDLVLHPGEHVAKALVLRGRLILEAGAQADEAVALGGDLVLRPGARAGKAVAVGGAVRLEGDARVDHEVVAVGGRIERSEQARVDGTSLSLSGQLDDGDLAGFIGGKVREAERCTVVHTAPARESAPEGAPGGTTWNAPRRTDLLADRRM